MKNSNDIFRQLTKDETSFVFEKAKDLSCEINDWVERNMVGSEEFALTTLAIAVELAIGTGFDFKGKKYDEISNALMDMLSRNHKDIKILAKIEREDASRRADA